MFTALVLTVVTRCPGFARIAVVCRCNSIAHAGAYAICCMILPFIVFYLGQANADGGLERAYPLVSRGIMQGLSQIIIKAVATSGESSLYPCLDHTTSTIAGNTLD